MKPLRVFRFFNKAGASGHVFLIKKGKTKNKGLAWGGIVGLTTAIAVVPTDGIVIPFAVDAQTSDKQQVRVPGSLLVKLDPEKAKNEFDFTVDSATGAYEKEWEQTLRANVVNQIMAPLRDKVQSITISAAASSYKDIADAIAGSLGEGGTVSILSCSLGEIKSSNEKVSEAIGATEREALLQSADKAMHDRRMKAAENDRDLKEYEIQTAQEVESKKAQLIAEQNKNKEAAATGDAKVIELIFAKYKEEGPAKLLAYSILKLAEGGRVGTLNISPDILTSLQQIAKGGQ